MGSKCRSCLQEEQAEVLGEVPLMKCTPLPKRTRPCHVELCDGILHPMRTGWVYLRVFQHACDESWDCFETTHHVRSVDLSPVFWQKNPTSPLAKEEEVICSLVKQQATFLNFNARVQNGSEKNLEKSIPFVSSSNHRSHRFVLIYKTNTYQHHFAKSATQESLQI